MRAVRRKRWTLAAVAVAAVGLAIAAYAAGVLHGSELQSVDARFSIRGTQPAPSDIVLVLIDGYTFSELDRRHLESEYPFPRRYDAKVIDRLRGAGARAIGLDIVFSQPTDETDDNDLIESIGRAHGRIVLAATEIGKGGKTDILGGGSLVHELGARIGEADLTLDSDNVVRRFAYSRSGLQSLPVVIDEVASKKPVARSLFGGGTLPVDFSGPPEHYRSISYSKVLLGDFPAGMFRNKIVVVGASAPVLHDYHATATSGSAVMPGPEIIANAVNTLQQGVPLRASPAWLTILLIVLLGIGAPLTSLRAHRLRTIIDAAVLAAIFSVGVQVAFNSGLIVAFAYPLLALALGTLGTLGVLYMLEEVERERVRTMFARFVPASIVEDVLATADENLRLAGVERDCTVMFSDLRGFTSFAETQPAAKVIEVVNYYLNEMTEAILAAGGTLIAYMGDGIMAVFGTPLEQPDHADRALRAAREMIGPRLDHFNDWLSQQGFSRVFEMGVGLNSGPVSAGNVGSAERVEYTAIGDTTNTAARLEGMTKDIDGMLLMSEFTRERLTEVPADLVPAGELEIRGRNARLAVWTLTGVEAPAAQPLSEPAAG